MGATGFKVSIRKLAIAQGVGRTRRQVILETLLEASAAALREAFPNVPVDTGMSRGAFRAIGRRVSVRVPIEPKRARRDRNPRVGESLATFSIIVDPGANRFSINFEAVFYQLNHLPFGKRAFDVFKAVAKAYINSVLPGRLRDQATFEIRTALKKILEDEDV